MLIPYVKLTFVFALMLLMIRFRMGLSIAVLAGSFIMALLFDISPLRWFELGMTIFSDTSILIVWGVVIFVLSLSTLMEGTKQAERFMAALAYRVVSPRIRMVFFPMLIGLLPMPGGAVFSAPMINVIAKELPMEEQEKSIINYWFRHTMEMSWPLYPTMILAASIGGISTPSLLMWTMPISVVYFGIGWFFFVRQHKFTSDPNFSKNDIPTDNWKTIGREGGPLFLAILGALFFELCFALFLPHLPMDYGVIVGLVLAVMLCLWQNDLGPKNFFLTLMKPSVRSMIFVVGALGVFKSIIADGGVAATLVSEDTGITGIFICAIVLPMAIGALTGLMTATAGAAFPLVVALVEASNSGPIGPWLMLAIACTMVGAMASPLHICFILSCEYFKVSLMRAVPKMIMPCICLLIAAVTYFFILRALF